MEVAVGPLPQRRPFGPADALAFLMAGVGSMHFVLPEMMAAQIPRFGLSIYLMVGAGERREIKRRHTVRRRECIDRWDRTLC